jgi:hypothetical protein
MTRFSATLDFEVDTGHLAVDTALKRELVQNIVAELQSFGGSRHPDDLLFNSLQKVRVTGLSVVKTARGRPRKAKP